MPATRSSDPATGAHAAVARDMAAIFGVDGGIARSDRRGLLARLLWAFRMTSRRPRDGDVPSAPVVTIRPLRTRRPADAAGRLVYAIGDVHGRYDLLRALLGAIASDIAGRQGGRRPLIVTLGDYVDRGAQSDRVVAALVQLAGRHDIELRALLGNHEDAMLRYLRQPDEGRDWLRFGGDATLRAYGIEPPDPDAPDEAHVAAAAAFAARLPPSHRTFLEALPLTFAVGGYAFVHAGARPGAALHAQARDDLLWIREPFLSRDHRFERVIVHGHTWTSDRARHRVNAIGIDTGAYATGVLTALRIEDRGLALFQARGTRDARAQAA